MELEFGNKKCFLLSRKCFELVRIQIMLYASEDKKRLYNSLLEQPQCLR